MGQKNPNTTIAHQHIKFKARTRCLLKNLFKVHLA